MTFGDLIAKYDVPVPRYTSYPTVPYWSESPSSLEWIDSLKRHLPGSKLGMYVHLPFCETLCFFCGCNTVITRNHDKEGGYLSLIEKEISLYKKNVPELSSTPLAQLHLGGGTPTFFSPDNLGRLFSSIYGAVQPIEEGFEGSVEVDPRHCSDEQLDVFLNNSIRRISFGVQDFNPAVQKAINRIQPFEMTRSLTERARAKGFDSVNFDLIFGLPHQTEESMRETIQQTISLNPDRIAFYSFAVVPWLKPAQKALESALPIGEKKRRLYEVGRELFINAGYEEIGMDHFALPKDALNLSLKRNSLHRNFMGYVETRTNILLSLGVSSISETPDCFHQNEKDLASYSEKLLRDELPTLRGHKLSSFDRKRREEILTLMTRFECGFEDASDWDEIISNLSPLLNDSLVEIKGRRVVIPEHGKPFLRNIVAAFDARMREKKASEALFSKAV